MTEKNINNRWPYKNIYKPDKTEKIRHEIEKKEIKDTWPKRKSDELWPRK